MRFSKKTVSGFCLLYDYFYFLNAFDVKTNETTSIMLIFRLFIQAVFSPHFLYIRRDKFARLVQTASILNIESLQEVSSANIGNQQVLQKKQSY